MEIGRIKGATRVLGEAQGYLGLPVRDIVLDSVVDGPKTPAMETAWIPSPADRAAIADGAPIILTVLGTEHPPVMFHVGSLTDV